MMQPRQLKIDDVIRVTNTDNNISAKFRVTYSKFLGLWPVRTLRECTLLPTRDFYFLYELNRGDVEWELAENQKS